MNYFPENTDISNQTLSACFSMLPSIISNATVETGEGISSREITLHFLDPF